MKRRLTIARSLINEPELLLLDEPTTGLDPQARHVLWDRLYRLKQRGVTLVLTTHYMDEAEQLCDRLVVMDGGRIVAEGSPRDADRRSTPPARCSSCASRPAGERRPRRRRRRHRGIGDRSESAARPRARSTPTTVRRRWPRCTARGLDPSRQPGAPQLARRRVPPPHRPHTGRLSDVRRPTHACARRGRATSCCTARSGGRTCCSHSSAVAVPAGMGLGVGALVDDNSASATRSAGSATSSSWPRRCWRRRR